MIYTSISIGAEGNSLGLRRYKKPELAGEDSRKELDVTERRKAELAGEQTRMEMEAMAVGDISRSLSFSE